MPRDPQGSGRRQAMTYPATPTFWLEATDRCLFGLRRYSSPRESYTYTCEAGWHEAKVITSEGQAFWHLDGDSGYRSLAAAPETPHDAPGWPAFCESGCGYEFTEDDHWQDTQDQLYRRLDTGQEMTLRVADPGASWDAWWMPDNWRGPDGIALMVRCPNGSDWHVDGQASNCTRKGEPHACWVRHGDPRQANVTVDKNGDTCAAGAGSIVAGDYHGFLQAGILTAG
jgi:hypothetical protein